MALDLVAGELIDLHQGQEDLASGQLRFLHAGSVQDDPTCDSRCSIRGPAGFPARAGEQ